MDMTKIVAPYYGVPEKNLQNSTNYALALANELKQKNKKLIVFLDEIDRVIMQDSGSGSKHSNDILTEFKRCFNLLKNHDNHFHYVNVLMPPHISRRIVVFELQPHGFAQQVQGMSRQKLSYQGLLF